MDTVLVTGANGEVGHGLIPALSKTKEFNVIALDINELDDALKPFVHEVVVANVLDKKIIVNLLKDHKITTVFHLAAILSTGGEKNPELAHSVNVGGAQTLLDAVNVYSQNNKSTIKFIFPSTVAVYGLPNLETKKKIGMVAENEFLSPITMYGINKLYCEMLGIYYSTHYSQLTTHNHYIDFRCVRFPGIISALTIPTGGTSDYAPEMIHSAAKGEGYESFVRADTQIPFMVMPDAVNALIQLTESPKEKLKKQVYNVSSFSVTAKEIAKMVSSVFSKSSISYKPDQNRQKIVDSWPSNMDDSPARKDWGWKPDYDIEKAFKKYLIPEISQKYR